MMGSVLATTPERRERDAGTQHDDAGPGHADGGTGHADAGPGHGDAGPRHGDAGMVTAELALGAGALAVLFTLLVGMIWVLAAQFGCENAATEIARQEARGDRVAVAAARARLPHGARVSIDRAGGGAAVTVELEARPWGDQLPAVPVQARAVAAWEPGEGPR